MTTPVNPPHHSDTGFYCLPCKKVSRGGLTHDACSPVRVVGADRVRGPLTHRLHPGKMQSMGSPLTLGLTDEQTMSIGLRPEHGFCELS